MRASTSAVCSSVREPDRTISKSSPFNSSSVRIVGTLCGSRPRICPLRAFSVSLIRSVRSNGRSPAATLANVSTAWCRIQSLSTASRRKNLRETSICLARKISRSRVSSGMPPICDRYMRIGSRLERACASPSAFAAWALGDRFGLTKSSLSGGPCGSSQTVSPWTWQAATSRSVSVGSPPSSGMNASNCLNVR